MYAWTSGDKFVLNEQKGITKNKQNRKKMTGKL